MPVINNDDGIPAVTEFHSGKVPVIKKTNISAPGFIAFIIILISVIFGFWFRLKGLGKFPLAVDEYFIVKSALNIIKYGIPEFESGGYYVRGLLQQYITAGLILTGIKVEFAARIFPLVSNMLVIPPLYKLAKKLSGQIFASVVIFIFCFSVWEIEMARFARMYAPFQALFTWYLLYFYEYVIEENSLSKKWIYILSLLSIFIFEAGILLVVLNFSLLLLTSKDRVSNLLLSGIIFILAFSYLSFDFMFFNTHHLLPAGISVPDTEESTILLPYSILAYIPAEPLSILIFSIISLINIYCIYLVFNKLKAPLISKLSYSLLVLLSLFHLFGVIFLFSVTLLALNWINLKQIKETPVKLILISMIINLLFWGLFIFTGLKSGTHYNSILKLFKETVNVLIKYPNFDILSIYMHTIPLFTIAAGILTAVLFIRVVLNSKTTSPGLGFLFVIILFLILLITFLNINYNETRYTFFIFPVILLLILYSIKDITETLIINKSGYSYIFIIPVVLFLIISEDFNFHHVVNIDSKEVNYRIGLNTNLAYHYYLRWDAKTPAEIVNENLKKNDIVIINSPVSEYYLKHLDYVYNDYRNVNFTNSSIYNGTKERWSNAKLIYRDTDLLGMINNRVRTIWLIVDNNKYLQQLEFYEKYKNNRYYRTIDNKLTLYKFP